jgi:hypothetical protein
MAANSVISPELVLVDPELRASLMAEFRVSASCASPVSDCTNRSRDSGRLALSAVSGDDHELRSERGRASLVLAGVVYALAGLAGILMVGALTVAALIVAVVMLAWLA